MIKAPLRKSTPPLEPGTYPAVCSKIVDLGTQDSTYGKRRQVLVAWQVPAERIQLTLDGVPKSLPRELSRRFTLSLNEKAALRAVLESWRGKRFDDRELQDFDLEFLIGRPCLIQVTNTPSRDGSKVYCNVAAVVALPKGTPAPELEGEGVTFSLSGLTEPTLPTELPEWIRTVISESDEFGKLCGVVPGKREPDPAWLNGAGENTDDVNY